MKYLKGEINNSTMVGGQGNQQKNILCKKIKRKFQDRGLNIFLKYKVKIFGDKILILFWYTLLWQPFDRIGFGSNRFMVL